VLDIKQKEHVKNEERSIVAAMISSTEFLKGVRPIYKPEFLTLPYARTVANWCADYYDKYDKAPSGDIKAIFINRQNEIHDIERAKAVEIFLDSLNGDEEIYNTEWLLDKAVKYFSYINIDNSLDKIRGYRLAGDLLNAEAELAKYKRIEKINNKGVNVFYDMDAMMKAIRSSTENILLTFPGDLGKMVRPIRKHDFLALIGPAKRGKTWWLQEIGLLAMWNGLSVLHISLETPEDPMLMRIFQRVNGELEPDGNNYVTECEVDIPSFDANFVKNSIINHRKEIRKKLSTHRAAKKMHAIQSLVKSRQYRLECFPSNSLNVKDGIIPLLDELEYSENFIPEMIVVDYADIMAPEIRQEKRHQIDETWQALRGLGQERHVVVVTASHSNKATFGRDIRQNDLSEDARKLNHVTLAISLNQLKEDIKNNTTRMSVLADRFGRFNSHAEVMVTHCLDIGMPYLDSKKYIRKEEEEE
jgi:hypothetical protein